MLTSCFFYDIGNQWRFFDAMGAVDCFFRGDGALCDQAQYVIAAGPKHEGIGDDERQQR